MAKRSFRHVAFLILAVFASSLPGSFPLSFAGVTPDFKRTEMGAGPAAERRSPGETLAVPPELGSVAEAFHRPGGSKTIYFIQDAHDSLEAQENISKIVQNLVSARGIKTVFEEGYEGPVPTDAYFGFLKDATVRRKVSYFFLDHLRIGGAEYAHINRARDFKLVGVDSIPLHKANVAQYRRVTGKREAVSKDLQALEAEVSSLGSKRFPKELFEWLKLRERWGAHKLELLDYVSRTAQLLSAKGAFTEGPFCRLRSLLEAQRSKDPAVAEKLRSIDPREISAELVGLEAAVGRVYCRDEGDKKLFDFWKILGLLKRLNDLEMTEEEFVDVERVLRTFDTGSLGSFIHQTTHKPLILSRQWESNIQDAVQFYKIAQWRDRAMAGHLEAFFRDPGETEAVLVFGGFHKENIQKILRTRGVSYQVIVPRITRPSPRHQDFYKKLMAVGSLPFEKEAFSATATCPEHLWVLPWGQRAVLVAAAIAARYPDRSATWDRYFTAETALRPGPARSETRAAFGRRSLLKAAVIGPALKAVAGVFGSSSEIFLRSILENKGNTADYFFASLKYLGPDKVKTFEDVALEDHFRRKLEDLVRIAKLPGDIPHEVMDRTTVVMAEPPFDFDAIKTSIQNLDPNVNRGRFSEALAARLIHYGGPFQGRTYGFFVGNDGPRLNVVVAKEETISSEVGHVLVYDWDQNDQLHPAVGEAADALAQLIVNGRRIKGSVYPGEIFFQAMKQKTSKQIAGLVGLSQDDSGDLADNSWGNKSRILRKAGSDSYFLIADEFEQKAHFSDDLEKTTYIGTVKQMLRDDPDAIDHLVGFALAREFIRLAGDAPKALNVLYDTLRNDDQWRKSPSPLSPDAFLGIFEKAAAEKKKRSEMRETLRRRDWLMMVAAPVAARAMAAADGLFVAPTSARADAFLQSILDGHGSAEEYCRSAFGFLGFERLCALNDDHLKQIFRQKLSVLEHKADLPQGIIAPMADLTTVIKIGKAVDINDVKASIRRLGPDVNRERFAEGLAIRLVRYAMGTTGMVFSIAHGEFFVVANEDTMLNEMGHILVNYFDRTHMLLSSETMEAVDALVPIAIGTSRIGDLSRRIYADELLFRALRDQTPQQIAQAVGVRLESVANPTGDPWDYKTRILKAAGSNGYNLIGQALEEKLAMTDRRVADFIIADTHREFREDPHAIDHLLGVFLARECIRTAGTGGNALRFFVRILIDRDKWFQESLHISPVDFLTVFNRAASGLEPVTFRASRSESRASRGESGAWRAEAVPQRGPEIPAPTNGASSVLVIEKARFFSLPELARLQFLTFAKIHKDRLWILIPDMQQGENAPFLQDLRTLLGSRVSNQLPEIARGSRIRVIGLADKDHDTRTDFSRRMDRYRRGLSGKVKDYFSWEGGKGLYVALMAARPEELAVLHGFRYDASGRYRAMIESVLQNLVANYVAILSAA